jgi:hypothetical protein
MPKKLLTSKVVKNNILISFSTVFSESYTHKHTHNTHTHTQHTHTHNTHTHTHITHTHTHTHITHTITHITHTHITHTHCINDVTTVKLGYNEHSVITNRFLSQIGYFDTQINPVITNPGYKK